MRYITCVRGGGEGIGSVIFQHLNALQICLHVPNIKYFYTPFKMWGIAHGACPIEMESFFNFNKLTEPVASKHIDNVQHVIWNNKYTQFDTITNVEDNTIMFVNHIVNLPDSIQIFQSQKNQSLISLRSLLKPLLNLREIKLNTNCVTVGLHIRRGDVKLATHKARWHSVECYLEVYRQLKDVHTNIKFYVFTEVDENTSNELDVWKDKSDVLLYNNNNPFEALSYMITTDILVYGNSAFGMLAAFYNSNTKIDLTKINSFLW